MSFLSLVTQRKQNSFPLKIQNEIIFEIVKFVWAIFQIAQISSDAERLKVLNETVCFQRICQDKSRKLHTSKLLLSWTKQLNCITNHMNKYDVIGNTFFLLGEIVIHCRLSETRITGKLPNILHLDFQRTFEKFLIKVLNLTGKVPSQIKGHLKSGKQIMRTNNAKCS